MAELSTATVCEYLAEIEKRLNSKSLVAGVRASVARADFERLGPSPSPEKCIATLRCCVAELLPAIEDWQPSSEEQIAAAARVIPLVARLTVHIHTMDQKLMEAQHSAASSKSSTTGAECSTGRPQRSAAQSERSAPRSRRRGMTEHDRSELKRHLAKLRERVALVEEGRMRKAMLSEVIMTLAELVKEHVLQRPVSSGMILQELDSEPLTRAQRRRWHKCQEYMQRFISMEELYIADEDLRPMAYFVEYDTVKNRMAATPKDLEAWAELLCMPHAVGPTKKLIKLLASFSTKGTPLLPNRGFKHALA